MTHRRWSPRKRYRAPFQGALTISDSTPRPQMPLESILAAMGDVSKTDGTLLVGIKEAGATRGVSVNGIELPLAARRAAERAIRQVFPSIEFVQGISSAVNFRSAQGVKLDTLHRTYINVRVPRNLAVLQALRNHPNVDYINPNFTNGVVRGVGAAEARATIAAAMATEYRPWGVDTVRAPTAWSLGYVGENVPFYMVDSGFDPSIGYGSEHPDFVFNMALNTVVGSHPEEPCRSVEQRCYWESPFHGSGVMGMAVGQRNGIGAVGVAPRQSSGVTMMKPILSTGAMSVSDYASAIRAIGDMNHTGQTQVGQTSLGYDDTNVAAYQAVADALSYTVNQRNTIFIAAAANNNGGPAMIPEVFPEAVAVGSLYQNLTRYSSPIDPKMELVAPGYQLRMSWNRDNDNGSPYEYTRVESGTSFAAPIVAGVALLTLQANPGLSASDVRTTLRAAARDLGPAGKDNEFGYGMVDAVCAVQRLTSCNPLSVSLSGPSYIDIAGTYTWEAVRSGGNGTYTYYWEYSTDGSYWSHVGSNQTYSTYVGEGDRSFYLRQTVTSGGQTATDQQSVTVAIGCGGAVIC